MARNEEREEKRREGEPYVPLFLKLNEGLDARVVDGAAHALPTGVIITELVRLHPSQFDMAATKATPMAAAVTTAKPMAATAEVKFKKPVKVAPELSQLRRRRRQGL
jgi:hypothetical protein